MKILGISAGHDSGACVVSDGKIIAAINEERLSRVKNHIGFPAKSIEKVLEISNTKISEIEYIAIEGKKVDNQNLGEEFLFKNKQKLLLSYFRLDKFIMGTELGVGFVRFILSFVNLIRKRKIKNYFYKRGFKGKFELIEHHLGHAASAYYTQEKNDGLVITADAGGEGYCSHIYIAKNNCLTLVHKILGYNSLAVYYGYVTKILGFTPLKHEGKILGLSASGNPALVEKKLKKFIFFDKKKINFVNRGGYYLNNYNKLKKELSEFSKEDIAAGIQNYTERLMLDYINSIIEKYSKINKSNLYLAGGIFANIKLNQKIANLQKVKSCYVFPNMGDGGLAAGCALNVYFDKKKNAIKKKHSMYLGSSHDISSKQFVINDQFKIIPYKNLFKFIATELNNNKIFGIFQGKMEYGPRALGNRSIICSPKNKIINETLNFKLKRSDFMPFAPCVLNEDFEYFFESNMKAESFEHMTFTCNTKKICEELAPAIVHIDKTARPQTVFKDKNLFLFKVLEEFKKISGIGMLINTSFNIHEEPIIESYENALKSFKISSLDFLILENKIIQIKR